MRATKKLTVSAMATAIGTALMAVGAVWDLVDLSLAALASLLIVVILIEVGGPFPWLVWLSTSLLTFICFMGSPIWLMYFVFGLFPILKYFIEKLKRPFWIILKLLYVSTSIIALVYLVDRIFKIPLFDTDSFFMKAACFLLFVAAFMAYDRLLTSTARLYTVKIRPRLKNLFK